MPIHIYNAGGANGVAFSLISETEVRLNWTPPENPNGIIKVIRPRACDGYWYMRTIG
ncbi:hypothetical protein KIN20_021627 [Parelaphostrongylus tenuis]|uniref:Uncharacterized protein n=1 Tax=Parelaphostrongylus tenuis TaxID=148309 RepID=A0AAD5QRP8_PARTN|nr:hypothetical protein KIN20_021627 [Parelaphostrongylus tenuis]